VVDTDIGTDVDDLLTVAMLASLPDTETLALTTVYGDTALRARIAAVVAAATGVTPVIAAGRERPLSGRPVFWAGHEGAGMEGLDRVTFSDQDAVALLIELAGRHPGALEILAIGPLTNLAEAVLADPGFAGRVARLYVMGGDFRPDAPRAEHNFSSDAVAAWIVLHSGMAMTVCGYEITTQVLLDQDDLDRIGEAAPAGPLIVDQTQRFWRWLDTMAPGGRAPGNSPHDPMALLTGYHPELFDIEPVRIGIVGAGPQAGQVTAVPDPASRSAIVRAARTGEVKEKVVGYLCGSPAAR
jgi:purine nucleosidase